MVIYRRPEAGSGELYWSIREKKRSFTCRQHIYSTRDHGFTSHPREDALEASLLTLRKPLASVRHERASERQVWTRIEPGPLKNKVKMHVGTTLDLTLVWQSKCFLVTFFLWTSLFLYHVGGHFEHVVFIWAVLFTSLESEGHIIARIDVCHLNIYRALSRKSILFHTFIIGCLLLVSCTWYWVAFYKRFTDWYIPVK